MKAGLILSLIISLSAYGAEKKTPKEMRQGTKAVDEKYLEALGGSETPERKTLSHDVHANQSKARQLEYKKDRQFQEENPVTTPYPKDFDESPKPDRKSTEQ